MTKRFLLRVFLRSDFDRLNEQITISQARNHFSTNGFLQTDVTFSINFWGCPGVSGHDGRRRNDVIKF